MVMHSCALCIVARFAFKPVMRILPTVNSVSKWVEPISLTPANVTAATALEQVFSVGRSCSRWNC